MDLIYTNASGIEQGVITKFALDLEEATDKDKCNFEIQMSLDDSVLELGSLIYAEETEIGGKVDSLKVDTAQYIVYASGRTWRGILASKIIEPSAGDAYKTVSGNIETVLNDIVSYIGLESVFDVHCDYDYNVNFRFDRYTDAYTGLLKMVSSYEHKLTLAFNHLTKKVTIGTLPIVDYANESEITSDMFEFKLEKGLPKVNHIIGLGSGELEARLVVHKYLQFDGSIGDTIAYEGANEITTIYDYPNCESIDDLAEKTAEQLEEASIADKMSVTARNITADVGDKFTAADVRTGISMTQYVVSKIITISNEVINYQYTVGENIK